MIGNHNDAERALIAHMSKDYSNLLSCDGTTRTVYLINDVVYKIDNGDYLYSCNVMEYQNITDFSSNLPDGVYFPQVAMYDINGNDIIAMEYITGTLVAECYCTDDEECDDTCAPRDIVAIMEDMLLDAGGFNVILNECGAYIIDVA